ISATWVSRAASRSAGVRWMGWRAEGMADDSADQDGPGLTDRSLGVVGHLHPDIDIAGCQVPVHRPRRPGRGGGACNELVAAGLADQLGLPVLDFRVLEMGGVLFFGSSWMQAPTFHPAITEDLFNRTQNCGCL